MANKTNKKSKTNENNASELKSEKIEFNTADGTLLSGAIWEPDTEIRAVLQITHGLSEHIGRYASLASLLVKNGIAVAGFDLRGHGQNAGNKKVASLGEDGWEKSIEDIHIFYEYINNRYPNVPHFMLGFSLGSFLLREYFSAYPNDVVNGAIIMSTGYNGGISPRWTASIIKKEIKKSGFDNTSDIVRKLVFDTYNKKFEPNKTPFDWFCSDEQQLKLYRSDALCRKDISSGLCLQMLNSMKVCSKKNAYKNWSKDMPILLLSGEKDPLGNFGKGTFIIRTFMIKAKIKNVLLKIYPNARHDLLHEEKNKTAFDVRNDIKEFILLCLTKPE